MSGHSKWSKIKHQKASTDAHKGQAFTKASRAIMLAVREENGIDDPDKNFRLRLAIEKAREVNMPKETIERAISRAAGEGGQQIEDVLYEAYGPAGSALIIEAYTDNRQRTVSLVKNVLDRYGGSLAIPGAVSYMFQKVGIILVPKSGSLTLDILIEKGLEAGARDVVEKDDVFEIYTDPHKLNSAKESFMARSIIPERVQLIMRPTVPLAVPIDLIGQVSTLIAKLTELDDVQEIYSNVE